MKRNRFAIAGLVLTAILTEVVHGQLLYPECASEFSDPDGDGYGWENGATCTVEGLSQIEADRIVQDGIDDGTIRVGREEIAAAEMERLVEKLNDNNTEDDIYLQEIYNRGGFLERSYQQIPATLPEGVLAKEFDPDDSIDIADTPVERFCDESGIFRSSYRNKDYWTGKHYASIDNRGRPLDAEMRAIERKQTA